MTFLKTLPKAFFEDASSETLTSEQKCCKTIGFSMISPLGPSWGSSKSAPKTSRTTATSASHFFEDVSGEIDIFEDPKVSPAISTSPFFEDVSGETLIFNKRGLKAAFSTSPFFEDVSGESPIFEDPKVSRPISTSPFCEDVSGETVIFSIRRLKR